MLGAEPKTLILKLDNLKSVKGIQTGRYDVKGVECRIHAKITFNFGDYLSVYLKVVANNEKFSTKMVFYASVCYPLTNVCSEEKSYSVSYFNKRSIGSSEFISLNDIKKYLNKFTQTELKYRVEHFQWIWEYEKCESNWNLLPIVNAFKIIVNLFKRHI